MSNRENSRAEKAPLLWPIGLVVLGVLILLSNFLILRDFRLADLWPLALVLFGAALLLRGDLIPSRDYRTFGITRGSIESATLEIRAGEIDVQITSLQNRQTERLIAGQFASHARPELRVVDLHAHLIMDRSKTPWLSFADWEMGLSQDLPWQIVIGTHLGQVSADLSTVIMQNGLISTGFGDIFFTAPPEAFEPIYLRSVLGNIHVTTPPGYQVRLTIQQGRFGTLQVDETRYQLLEPGIYFARDINEEFPLVDVVIHGTFGSIYLS